MYCNHFTICIPLRYSPSLKSVPSRQCTRLQLQSNLQEAELRRREQQINRLKERLADRHREKGPCETHSVVSLLQFPEGFTQRYLLAYQIFTETTQHLPSCIFLSSHRGVELSAWRSRQKRTAHQIIQVHRQVRWLLLSSPSHCCLQVCSWHLSNPRLLSPLCRREEAALRLMLERREAELREAMKLRHSLTTLLHALRVDMEHVSETREPFSIGQWVQKTFVKQMVNFKNGSFKKDRF